MFKRKIFKKVLVGALSITMLLGNTINVGATKQVKASETAVVESAVIGDDNAGESGSEQITSEDGSIRNATANISPKCSDNLCVRLISKSELVATENGYMRVFYDGIKIYIEYYDDNFNILSKKSIDMELQYWGCFYAGTDGYYIVQGQDNTSENDTAEVIRVIKYDKNWTKIGTARINSNKNLFGGEVRSPFDYGCVEMVEYGNTLYIVTGHEGYVDPSVGQGHQGYLMIAVNKDSMTGQIVDCDYWHSFAQYISSTDSNLYVLEQSEGSRYTKLSKYDVTNLNNESIPVFKYGGTRSSAWAIPSYASVDGMVLSSDSVICLGTSIDQSKYDSVTSNTPHNIYLTVTPMSNFSKDSTSVKWITNYTGEGKSFIGTKIVKIDNNRFMVSWEEYNESQTPNTEDALSSSIFHYIFINENGDKISEEFTAAAPISDCQPIVKNSKIVYYASNANMVNFYCIDTKTGAFSKKLNRIAGDNATWKLKEGVLTISGKGAMFVDTTVNYRYPISSTVTSFIYNTRDNAWKTIKLETKKIVIETGITSIPDNAFQGFSALTEVEIEPGLTMVGKEAFYSCNALSKITIPDSVSSIGEDFLWTGYTWVGSGNHVTRATVYAKKGSYAYQYAKDNSISVYDTSKSDIPTETPAKTPTETPTETPIINSDITTTYHTHIQTYGDSQEIKSNGQMAGTSGEAKRLENIWIKVAGNDNVGIQYTTHCQTYGWMPWSTNGETNGTSKEAKRLEAIKIQLTGADANKYDVYYRVHAQTYGWLAWAKNGEPSGTSGYGKRLEGIQVVVLKKGSSAPGLNYCGVSPSSVVNNSSAYISNTASAITIPGSQTEANVMYKTHVQSYGWQNWVNNGSMAGTSGQSKRLEGINIKLSNCKYAGGVAYRTHVQTYGWMNWVNDGVMSGTSGEAKRLEAIEIKLTGEMAEKYDIYYRVHAQTFGWMGWAKNGESAGTAGYAKRLEGIQIVLVPKGQAAPGTTKGAYIAN